MWLCTVHIGLLAAEPAFDCRSLITSGEDGKVCRLTSDGVVEVLSEQKGWWIDKIACGPSGVIGYGTGKKGCCSTGRWNKKAVYV